MLSFAAAPMARLVNCQHCVNCCTRICCLLVPMKKWQSKNTYLTVQLVNIDLPAVDQRNLEDLEPIFPQVHTPLWAQCTCPGPPRASLRWARRSYGRGAGRGATATKAAHQTNPYFSKELFISDYYFYPGFWQKCKFIYDCGPLKKMLC